MTRPLVSCVVPVYNGERYLREALQSILAQTYEPLEVIVVDDGSTDGTPCVAHEFVATVRYLRQSTAGPSATRNCGVAAATGSFVAFLEPDDLWHPEKLARQMASFNSRPETAVCVTYARNFWIPELAEGARLEEPHPRAQGVPGFIVSAIATKRTLFDRVGFFDTSLIFTGHTDWLLRAMDDHAIIEVLPEVLTYRRMHHTNLTRREAAACRSEYLRVLNMSLTRRRIARRAGSPRSEDRSVGGANRCELPS
jgi:glycosyltransferase involved in cell wall biosynthesis